MNEHFDPGAMASRIDEVNRLVREENERFEIEENAGRVTGRDGERHYELIEALEEELEGLTEQMKAWRAAHRVPAADYDPDRMWERITSVKSALEGLNDGLSETQENGEDDFDAYRRIEAGGDELLDLKAGLLDWIADGGRPPTAWAAR